MKTVSTDKAPMAIGPYSQAKIWRGIVFASGQLPLHPSTGQIVGDDITTQTKQALDNLGFVLEAAGSGFEKVLKTTCFLAEMSSFEAFNDIYAKYLPGNPARSCVAVKQLPKGVMVEVEAIAEI